jgi:hypothetical protein
MAADLASIYLAGRRVTNTEQADAMTSSLLAAYEDPSTVLILFELIGGHPDPYVRQAATVGLKLCFSLHWKDRFTQRPEGEQIKATILMLLPAQMLLIAKNLVDYSEPIFETELPDWPDLFTTVQGLTDTDDHIVLANHILYSIVRFCKKRFIAANIQLFEAFGQLAITGGTPSLESAYAMLGAVISFLPPEMIGRLEPIVASMLETFAAMLVPETAPIARSIAISLGDAFHAKVLPIAPKLILDHLLLLAEDPAIDRIFYVPIFIAVTELVSWHGSALLDANPGVTARLLGVMVDCTAKVDNQGLYEANEDATTIASNADMVARHLKDPDYFRLLMSFPETDDLSVRLAYALVVFNSLEACQEEVLENMKWIAAFVDAQLKIPSVSVQEVVLMIASDVGALLSDDLADLGGALITQVLSFLDGEILTRQGLKSLIAILNARVTISDAIIQAIVSKLMPFIGHPEISALAVEALAGVVFAAEEDIGPYAPLIGPSIFEAAAISEETNPILKQHGIIALAQLLRFAPAAVESVFSQGVQLIFQAGRSEDTDVRNAVMIAVGDLIISKIPLLLEYRLAVQELIDWYFTTVLFAEQFEAIDNEGIVANDSALTGFTNVLKLIKWIFKSYPDLLPDDLTQWLEIPMVFIPVAYVDLQTVAISAGLSGAIFTRSADGFCSQLSLALENSKDGIVIGKIFKAIGVLIVRDVPGLGEFIQQFIGAAWLAIDGQLRCQKSEELSPDSSQHIYKFLRLQFERDPQFPMAKLIQHGKKLLDRQGRMLETSQYISLLQRCYEVAPSLPSLVKKQLLANVNLAFQKFNLLFVGDDPSPFSVPPTPLAALRAVLEREAPVVGPILPTLLPVLQGILAADFQGETYYWSTITNALAFLASLMRLDPAGFAYDHWLPLMVPRLLIRSEEQYADAIYATVLGAIAANGAFGTEATLLASCAQTLGLKDRRLEELALSEATMQLITQTTSQLLVAANGSVSLPDLFPDVQSYNRFAVRLGIGV